MVDKNYGDSGFNYYNYAILLIQSTLQENISMASDRNVIPGLGT